MYINKKHAFCLFITFYPALFFLSVLTECISSTNLFVPSLVFLLFYFHLIIKTIRNTGMLSLYSFYLYTSFFFIYSKIFFTVVGYTSFLIDYWPAYYEYSKETGLIFLVVAFVSHYVLDIYISITRNRKNYTDRLLTQEIGHNIKLQKIALFFFLLSFPFILVKEVMALQYLKNFGYLFLFSGEAKINYPVWTKGAGTVFYLSFLFLLVSKPSKILFKIVSFLFIGYLFVDALKGGRANLICGVTSIIYFYNKFYPRQIQIRKIILFFVLSMMVALCIGQTRDSRSTKNIKIDTRTAVNFFNSQSVSIAVPLSVIEWKDNIKNYRQYPFIFTELVKLFKYSDSFGSPCVERVKANNELESVVSYIYSPENYIKGWGLGVAFLAEAYDSLGFLGIVFWSIVLGIIIEMTERNVMRKNANVFFSWFVVNSVLFLPRGHFFAFITSAYKYSLIALALCCLIRLFSYPKKLGK